MKFIALYLLPLVLWLGGWGGKSVQAQSSCQTSIDSVYWAVDVNAHININSNEEVSLKRDSIINYLWRDGGGFPASFVDAVGMDIGSWGFIDSTNYPNLQRLDIYTINMDSSFTSYVFACNPIISNNKLMIVHEGHTPFYPSGIDSTMGHYLEAGYTILYMNMPIIGPNTGPPSSAGFLHDGMAQFDSPTLNPMKFFFEPIARSLNYALSLHTYDEVSMIGISGGGWTASYYAAIDPRVRFSYAVAGSYPNFLKGPPCGSGYLGDYEQVTTEIAGSWTHLDLYLLAAHGEGRKHVQVINQFDPCCNGGILYQVYENHLKDRINCFNKGEFEVFLDSTHAEHKISLATLNHISTINCGSSVVLSSPAHNYTQGYHPILSSDTITAENKISNTARVAFDAANATTLLPGFEVTASNCGSFVVKAGKGCN
ncbi:MAG: hypothetical protein EAZ50_07125 [Runella slithyformis]|nr:MAG: hypothetical protein EAZ80_05820 [Runella slithyformis]TAF81184.1 MAG: hypothetical protein EAZ50_07125 [Runella slithyformis]